MGYFFIKEFIEYEFVGCYGDDPLGLGIREFPNLSASDENTIELCVNKCSEYKYAALQYG